MNDAQITPFDAYSSVPPVLPPPPPTSGITPYPFMASSPQGKHPSKPRSRRSIIGGKKSEKGLAASLAQNAASQDSCLPATWASPNPSPQGGKSAPGIHPLPIGFVERGIALSVRYELTLLIKRGRITPDSQ